MNLQPLVDLCRAYDALGNGTPIVATAIADVKKTIIDAIVSQCIAIADESVEQPAPVAPVESKPVAPAKTPEPVKSDSTLDLSTYLERFMAIANTKPSVVKPVLQQFGIDRGGNAKPEHRAAVIAALEAAANG